MEKGPGDLLGRNAGAGVGAGVFPVIEACAGGTAALDGALLHENNLLTGARRGNGREAARHAASQDKHVTLFRIHKPQLRRPGPGILIIHAFTSGQATQWPGVYSLRGMSPARQPGLAWGQRAAKRQPGLGLTGLVTSPWSRSRCLWRLSMLGMGMAASSALV